MSTKGTKMISLIENKISKLQESGISFGKINIDHGNGTEGIWMIPNSKKDADIYNGTEKREFKCIICNDALVGMRTWGKTITIMNSDSNMRPTISVNSLIKQLS